MLTLNFVYTLDEWMKGVCEAELILDYKLTNFIAFVTIIGKSNNMLLTVGLIGRSNR